MKRLTLSLCCFFIVLSLFGQREKFSTNIDSLTQVFKNVDQDERSRSRAFLQIIANFQHPDTINNFLVQTSEIVKENKSLAGLHHFNRVKVHLMKLENEEGVKLADELINSDLFDHIGRTAVGVHSMKARMLKKMGLLEESMKSHYQAIETSKIVEGADDAYRMIEMLNIAALHMDQQDYEPAKEILNSCISMLDTIPYPRFEIAVRLNLGRTYFESNNYEAAKIQYERSIFLADSLKNLSMKSAGLNNLGRIFHKQKLYSKAERMFDTSLEICKSINDEIGIAEVYSFQSHHYHDLGKYNAAISLAKKAYSINQKAEDIDEQLSNLQLLYWSYEGIGDFNNAFHFHKKYVVLKDSLYSAKKATEFTRSNMKNQFKQEKELLALQKQKDEQILIAEAKANRNLAGGVGALALLGFGFFYNARRQNKVIEQKNDQLESLNHTKDRIFAIIGHDLRKPAISFRGISKVINYLVDSEDYTRLKKVGSEVEKDALSLYKLTDNLLSWALMQKNVMPHNPSEVSPAEIAADTLTVFQRVAEEKNITLRSEVSDDLRVFADPNSLATIIRNITDNALKYTPAGGTVIIKAIDSDQGVKIVVEDSGIGIEQDKIKDIFLLQKDKSERGTSGEKGTGIGLHLIKELISINHGEVEVESELGKGTKVVVMLPKRALAAA